MGGLFGKPKVSKPKPTVINQAAVQDTATQQAQADSAEEARRRAMLGANLLFDNGSDANNNDPNTQKAKLLGD
ncbi:MAG TPA: hypothetical protein VN081_03955 [Dongiaceae bacterium]|nr:hypothetical protein [Dongiaceae bacterium]